jgi:hypothetical protein
MARDMPAPPNDRLMMDLRPVCSARRTTKSMPAIMPELEPAPVRMWKKDDHDLHNIMLLIEGWSHFVEHTRLFSVDTYPCY